MFKPMIFTEAESDVWMQYRDSSLGIPSDRGPGNPSTEPLSDGESWTLPQAYRTPGILGVLCNSGYLRAPRVTGGAVMALVCAVTLVFMACTGAAGVLVAQALAMSLTAWWPGATGTIGATLLVAPVVLVVWARLIRTAAESITGEWDLTMVTSHRQADAEWKTSLIEASADRPLMAACVDWLDIYASPRERFQISAWLNDWYHHRADLRIYVHLIAGREHDLTRLDEIAETMYEMEYELHRLQGTGRVRVDWWDQPIPRPAGVERMLRACGHVPGMLTG